jgi:hypothetical protein
MPTFVGRCVEFVDFARRTVVRGFLLTLIVERKAPRRQPVG